MKVFFPVIKNNKNLDLTIEFINCKVWNTIESAFNNYNDKYIIVSIDANYWNLIIKMFQRHPTSLSNKERWMLAYNDMNTYYNWAFK